MSVFYSANCCECPNATNEKVLTVSNTNDRATAAISSDSQVKKQHGTHTPNNDKSTLRKKRQDPMVLGVRWRRAGVRARGALYV